jgi:hypothetical protein
LTGHDLTKPMSIATAQPISSHTKRGAGITHGKGIHTLRHGFAPPLLEAGVALRTMQRLLGHRSIDTPPRYLPITRQHVATVHRPCDLRGCPECLPSAAAECGDASRGARGPWRGQPARTRPAAVGTRCPLPPLWRYLPADPWGLRGPAKGHRRHHRLSPSPTRRACGAVSPGWLCALGL